jgi:hypothetical protein
MEKVFNKQSERGSSQAVYANQLLTVQDLYQFKKQLLEELLIVLKNNISNPAKKWLKAHEVRRLLKISPGTLQTLKRNGTIPYTQIGGVHFFDYEDIQRMLETGKSNSL